MNDNSNGAAALVVHDREAAVERLYFQNFGFIRELASSDPTLYFECAENLIKALAARLFYYHGPLTDENFRQWVNDAIIPAIAFASIYEHCKDSVRAAIIKAFSNCLDLGITADHYDDAEQNTWLWTWTHLKELRDPKKSRANITTRLNAAAKFQALTIRKSLLRAKERLSSVDISRIGMDPQTLHLVVAPASHDMGDPYERSETLHPNSGRLVA